MNKLLIKDKNLRLTDPVKIKNHPFFSSVDFDQLALGPSYNASFKHPKPELYKDDDTYYFDKKYKSISLANIRK